MAEKHKFIVRIYGNTKILAFKCPRAIRDRMAHATEVKCCGNIYRIREGAKLPCYRVTTGGARRKGPTAAVMRAILLEQDDACLYCERRFGTFVTYRDKIKELRPRWDHFRPYCYDQDSSKENFVAACQLCNGIKSSKHFDTVDKARAWINKTLNPRLAEEDRT